MMPPRKRGWKNLRVIFNLIGVFLIHLPSRPLLYFGNLAVYVPSYVLIHTGQLAMHNHMYNLNVIENNTINENESSSLKTDSYTFAKNNSVNITQNNSQILTLNSEHGIQESWFVPVFSTAWMFGTFLSGVFANFVRTRFVIGLGIIFQSGSLIISFFTISVSEATFFITLCIFIGFGAGLYEGLLLKNYVVVRLGKRTATVTSLVLSSGPLGGVVINQFITWYTNPDNLSPDVKMGEMRIFTQEAIQKRIPPMFLILGFTMLGLTSFGFLMLKERKDKAESDEMVCEYPVSNSDESQPFEGEYSSEYKHGSLENGAIYVSDFSVEQSLKKNTNILDGSSIHSNDVQSNNFENDIKHNSGDSIPLQEHECHNKSKFTESNGNEKNVENRTENLLQTPELDVRKRHESEVKISAKYIDMSQTASNVTTMTPLELLKSVDFYKIAVVYIFGSSARLFLSVYYKIYGQEWIKDDHFLTNLATAMSFLAVFTTVIWGLILDKIGLKLCFTLIYTGISVFFLLMYFSAQLNKWAYFFVTLSNSSFVNYLYPIFTIALIKWFGRDYLSAKLGIAEIFSTAGYFIATFVLAELMASFGYLSGFIWTSSVHFVGLIVIILTFPKAF